VRLHYRAVLLLTPLLFAYARVQVVVPPLTALLADATWQVLCDKGPILRPVNRDQFEHKLVLFWSLRGKKRTQGPLMR
jgi:hypothetical protein